MRSERLAIGVDLGATKIASALVSSEGEVLASSLALTYPEEGPEAVLARLAKEIDALSNQATGLITGVGIGSPGIVDYSEGIIQNAVNLGWDAVPLAEGVRSRLKTPLPIWLEKDTNASALGELYFGAGLGCKDFVYLSIGSGLGGGVIANGELVAGVNGTAAEIGHLSLNPRGRPCICGQRGCAETSVSGAGLVTVFNELVKAEGNLALSQTYEKLTAEDIVEAAADGDRIALAAFERVGSDLGIVMAACAAVLNPRLFVIGGGLGLAAFSWLIPAACVELEQRVTSPSVKNLEIVSSRLASSAVGAACIVWQRS